MPEFFTSPIGIAAILVGALALAAFAYGLWHLRGLAVTLDRDETADFYSAVADVETEGEQVDPARSGLVATGPYELVTEDGDRIVPIGNQGVRLETGELVEYREGVLYPVNPPDRERTPSGLLDNEPFFQQIAADGEPGTEADFIRRTQDARDQVNRGFDMPGIRLPKPNKAAFSEAALFAQQSDMRTHDHGLQVVLDALHMVVKTYAGYEEIPLRDYKFNMNFAHAAASDNKRFVVRMKHPMHCQIELIQVMVEGSFHPTWRAVIDGEDITLDNQANIQVEVQRPRRQGREERVIDLDFD